MCFVDFNSGYFRWFCVGLISVNSLCPAPGELSQSDELLLSLLLLPPVDNLRLLESPMEIDSLADGLQFWLLLS